MPLFLYINIFMQTMIVGDSFVENIDHSWIGYIKKHFKLNVCKHESFSGGCEYYFYEQLTNISSKLASKASGFNIELLIVSHTEPQRIANANYYPINYMNVSNMASYLSTQIREAAKQYYQNIYHEKFHGVVHNLLIQDIQKIATNCKFKQIHFQSFDIKEIPITNGLWITGGLDTLARTQDNDYYKNRNLINHFSNNLNKKLAHWLIPKIENYVATKKDLEIVELNTEEIISLDISSV